MQPTARLLAEDTEGQRSGSRRLISPGPRFDACLLRVTVNPAAASPQTCPCSGGGQNQSVAVQIPSREARVPPTESLLTVSTYWA